MWHTRVLRGHIALSSAVFPEGTTGHMLDLLARTPLWQVICLKKCVANVLLRQYIILCKLLLFILLNSGRRGLITNTARGTVWVLFCVCTRARILFPTTPGIQVCVSLYLSVFVFILSLSLSLARALSLSLSLALALSRSVSLSLARLLALSFIIGCRALALTGRAGYRPTTHCLSNCLPNCLFKNMS